MRVKFQLGRRRLLLLLLLLLLLPFGFQSSTTTMPMMTLFRNLLKDNDARATTTRGRANRVGDARASFEAAAGETLHPNWPPPWHDSTRKAADSTPPLLEATSLCELLRKTTTISSSSSTSRLSSSLASQSVERRVFEEFTTRVWEALLCAFSDENRKSLQKCRSSLSMRYALR